MIIIIKIKKILGPGPAAYSLPTTLGRKSYKERAPAYSFGMYFDPNNSKYLKQIINQ